MIRRKYLYQVDQKEEKNEEEEKEEEDERPLKYLFQVNVKPEEMEDKIRIGNGREYVFTRGGDEKGCCSSGVVILIGVVEGRGKEVT